MLNIIKDILSFSFYTILFLVALYFVGLILAAYYAFIGFPFNEWIIEIVQAKSAAMKAPGLAPIDYFIDFIYSIIIAIAFCIVNFPALVIMGALFGDHNPIQIVQIRKA